MVVAVAATGVGCQSCQDHQPADARPKGSASSASTAAPLAPDELARRVTEVVTRELTDLRAMSASELIAGAPARALVGGPLRALPYGDGRTLQVPLVLSPGPPGGFRVATDLSIHVMMSRGSNHVVSVTARPAREDLATAVSLALAGEMRALEVASAALDSAHVARPADARTWADALAFAVVDARVPRAQLVGAPSWHLMFGPIDSAHGWDSVVMDASTFGVTMVNGQAPGTGSPPR